MVNTDGSWQDITASYVQDGRSVGQGYGRHDGPDDALPRGPQAPRRPLPIPPLEEGPILTASSPLSLMDESELNVSSDSWASLRSDNPSFADSSTDSAVLDLPGAFSTSDLSKRLPTHPNRTEIGEQYAVTLATPDGRDLSSGRHTLRPSSASSTTASEGTADSDWTPPIASESGYQTPRKVAPKIRQHAVKSPRLARQAVVASPSRGIKASASASGRSLEAPNASRRRKGSANGQDESDEPRVRRRRNQQNTWLPIVKDLASLLFSVTTLPLRTLAMAIGAPIQEAIKWIIILSFFAISIYYVIRSPMQSALGAVSGASSLISLGPMLYSGIMSPVQVYCSTVGIGCSTDGDPVDVGKIAKQVGTQALQAHDMFTSVVALGDPAALALNHVEIWELAVAVQVSSGLENRHELGNQLRGFGDKIRDVKDVMGVLHSKGITTFQWALHRFTRLEKTLELAESKPRAYTNKRIKAQLDDLFKHLDESLKDLLKGVENAIPLANQASEEGGLIRTEFGSEKSRMQRARDDQPFWRRLKDIGSFAGRRLREDIRVTTDTIDTVKELRFNLENTRSFLISYRDQVGYFKSGFQGFHIGDHGLDPEDEVATLRDIMQRFEDSVEKARYASSPEGLRESINARQKTLGE